MSSRAATVACAVVLAVVVVADGVTVAVRRHPDRRPPTALERALPALESFVEQARGLRFRRRVNVQLESDAAFSASLRRVGGGGPGFVTDAMVGLLRALGLVDGPFDPSALGPALDDRVVGFYSPGTNRLLVRGGEPTPLVRRVLVHELTHALDDQHFRLKRFAPDSSDEVSTSFTALVEGDAVRVEAAYLNTLSPAERLQADQEAGATASAPVGVPRVFEALTAYPYAAGRAFVDALVAAGGTARVDAAFARPPVSSEQVLHPDRYLAGDAPAAVTVPRRAVSVGQVVGAGSLGELFLRLVLQETLDRDAAVTAAGGWGGDQWVAWSAGTATCVRDAVRMDTPADRADLVAGLRRWAAGHSGATLEDADPVIVTRCA
ncbi:MAG: hypothetical protein ABR511_01745 [Acidimicrobiales bacterium]